MKRLHELRKDGRVWCCGRKVAGQGATPCERCAKSKARAEQKADQKKHREEAMAQRHAALKNGVLCEQANGNFAVRYSLNGRVETESLRTCNRAKALILLPMAMHWIRRNGKPMRNAARCAADSVAL